MSETATGENILPFYIVCDESGSMEGIGGITAINEALPELHATIAADPLVDDKCRIGLIGFSDFAEELVPLSRSSDIPAMPGAQAKGVTNYGEAFALLRFVIDRDIDALKAQGYQVYRPAVFFITDGEPTDDQTWEAAYRALIDKTTNRRAPNVIAFGVNGANPTTIAKIGTVAGFVASSGINPGSALREILKSLTNTIVTSSSSSSPQLVVPAAPDGCVAVQLQPVT